MTGAGNALGGGLPAYGIYAARDGHIACAALEPHFFARLCSELAVGGTRAELEAAFATRPAAEWQTWAHEHDVPIVAVVNERETASGAPRQ
jgi:alpha-methylacyl-CoA racemase